MLGRSCAAAQAVKVDDSPATIALQAKRIYRVRCPEYVDSHYTSKMDAWAQIQHLCRVLPDRVWRLEVIEMNWKRL